MTTPHRATPDEWEAVQLHADPDAYCHRDSCILELHYRVEALEAAQQAHIDGTPEQLEPTSEPGVNYRYSPVTVAECGGPCEQGPQYCHCGQIKPEPMPAPCDVIDPVKEESSAAQDDDPQTLHTVALGMVDSLERLQVLTEILDTLRRAIQEPMEQSTPPPAPAPETLAEALAARPLLEKVSRLGDCIGQQTVAQVQQLAEQASAWLRDNPPGQPVAIEPRGCPTPGACSCVEPASAGAGGVGVAGGHFYGWKQLRRWSQAFARSMPPRRHPAPAALRARALLAEADATLAQPEAATPTDEELLAMRSWSSHGPTLDSDLVDFGRRCYNLSCQHAGLAHPEPIFEVMLRHAPSDYEALMIAQGMQAASGQVISITHVSTAPQILSWVVFCKFNPTETSLNRIDQEIAKFLYPNE
jgi:hypothetical protein